MTAEVFARKDTDDKPGPEDALGVLWPYVDGQYVPDMPLDWVTTWDKNPRKTFEDAALRELAESIRADGVQQPIVVRVLTARIEGALLRRVQIVMGERRYLASREAGRTTIPVMVRVGLSDRDALRLAVVENLKRADLNAMEEADSYRALLDVGYSQVEIAAQIGVAESTISNALRLRKLPQSIRDMVTEGKLTGSHARALLRFEGFEAAQIRMAELASKGGASARSLEQGVPFYNTLVNEGVAGYPNYEMRGVCAACPFAAYRNTDEHRGVCLNPPHIAVLEAEIKAERAAKQQALLEDMEARKQALIETTEQAKKDQAARNIVGALLDGVDSKRGQEHGQTEGAAQTEAAGQNEPSISDGGLVHASAGPDMGAGTAGNDAADVSAPPLERPDTGGLLRPLAPGSAPTEIFVSDLSHGMYAHIGKDDPAECQENCATCPCRVLARYSEASTQTSAICIDPKRQTSIKAQQTRAAQKERKQTFGDTAERLFGLKVAVDDARALALLCFKTLDYLPRDVMKQMQADVNGTALEAVLRRPRYERKEGEVYRALATLSPQRIVEISLRAALLHEMQAGVVNKSDHCPDTRWYFGEAATSPAPNLPESDDAESEDTERVTTCAECEDVIADEDLHTPVIEEGYLGQELESGVYLCGDELDGLGAVCASCASSVVS